MAESDGQERTEQPTEQRLRQAREKGQIPVPRSWARRRCCSVPPPPC
ncbi:EscU/YscU/HrcU family type III secretion system export apparatus switch protein [Oceanimonas sp. NS1]|nr:EscU/YscU/HrcU family type III secretion system export apparatus switch protein [Oceanimonas sp. NS1]